MKMSRLEFIIGFLCIVVLVGCELGHAKQGKYLIEGKNPIPCQIVVDKSGHGHFSNIQSAINSVPSNNKHWVCIFIKAGTYREKVKIPYEKPYILLKGERKKTTQVIWDDHDSVTQSPTFTSMADNVVVSRITFVNSYNGPYSNGKNPRVPAVAAMIVGDKTSFYRCGFSGVQDTLWDVQGRHYFNSCTIEGAVDFIFGSGQSLYENCGIHFIGGELETGLAGFITAQGRTSPNDANGFVFKNCFVQGTGSTYLGRPWRSFARVFFYNSSLTNVVQPEGWNAWNAAGHEHQITFAEHGCHGAGSDTSSRVRWEKKLSSKEVKQLASITFIDNEGWLQKQPR